MKFLRSIMLSLGFISFVFLVLFANPLGASDVSELIMGNKIDDAVVCLSKLSPEDAITQLDALHNTAGAFMLGVALVMGSDKMDAVTAAKILEKMKPVDVAQSLQYTSEGITNSYPGRSFSTRHVSVEKSAEILNVMDPGKAKDILNYMAMTGSDGAQLAAQIMAKVSVDRTVD